MITTEMVKTAMEFGLGPLEGEFETPELRAIHDLWVDGGSKINEAERRLREVIDQEELVGGWSTIGVKPLAAK